ncbi:hypothetical protein MHYP_G00107240 [Metynnis hypsauchen]
MEREGKAPVVVQIEAGSQISPFGWCVIALQAFLILQCCTFAVCSGALEAELNSHWPWFSFSSFTLSLGGMFMQAHGETQ